VTKRIVLGEVRGYYNDRFFKIEIGRDWMSSKVLVRNNVYYEELKNVKKVTLIVEAGYPTKLVLEVEN